MNGTPSPAEALFLAAAEIAEPQERTAFLTRECGDDCALRERVDGLLASHEGAGDFLESSAPSPEVEAEFARLKREYDPDELLQTDLYRRVLRPALERAAASA